jgi:hypothetical protein
VLSLLVEIPFKREVIRLSPGCVNVNMVIASPGHAFEPPAASRDNVPSIGGDMLTTNNYERFAFIVNGEIVAVCCGERPAWSLKGMPPGLPNGFITRSQGKGEIAWTRTRALTIIAGK